MVTSLVDADSLLAIDVGSITTRVALFDVVDGRYRFLAAGKAPTTVDAPYNDIGEGVRLALDQLQAVTGRIFIDANEQLVIPSNADGVGIDTIAATISVGSPLRVVIVGLLEDVSLKSAEHLARTSYTRVVEAIHSNDRRKTEARIDAILRARPDLIVVAGGTDGGASQSVQKLLDAVGLANYLLPADQRPELLYVGNRALREEVRTIFENLGTVRFAPNVRPTLDYEDLDAAQMEVAEIASAVRSRQILGVSELDAWSGGGLIPSATGLGRVVRFLSKVYDPAKGVLGVDVGASRTTAAAAFSGSMVLKVFPELGLGSPLADVFDHLKIQDVLPWIHLDVDADYLRQYIHNKALYPGQIPVTDEDIAIEQALARVFLMTAMARMNGSYPFAAQRVGEGLTPWFEPIIAMGSVLTNAPKYGQSLMLLLDGLQPTGVTTIVLDKNHLSPSLGAAAAINPVLAVQVLESSTYINLGTVISPIGDARLGTPILRVHVSHKDGRETQMDVNQGSIETIQLSMGEEAELRLQPLHRYDIGMGGPGRGGRLRVIGGALGVVIDARGRPFRLPTDPARRKETIAKWRWSLGC